MMLQKTRLVDRRTFDGILPFHPAEFQTTNFLFTVHVTFCEKAHSLLPLPGIEFIFLSLFSLLPRNIFTK
jgi:hypothetical protein